MHIAMPCDDSVECCCGISCSLHARNGGVVGDHQHACHACKRPIHAACGNARCDDGGNAADDMKCGHVCFDCSPGEGGQSKRPGRKK